MNATARRTDAFIRDLLDEPIPSGEQKRLQHRFAELEERLAQKVQSPPIKSRMTRRAFNWAAAASAAAIATATITLWDSAAPPAWADVAANVASKPWLHMVGEHSNGTRIQFWISLSQGIYSMKAGETEFATHGSQGASARWSWRAPSKAIQKHEYQALPGELGHLATLLPFFASGAADLELSGGDEIVDQSRKTVERDGKKFWQYTFTLKAFDNGRADTYIVVFEVDPETGLPVTWTRRSLDGMQEISFRIAYPQSGPKDIYALGAPKSAEIVDVSE